MLTLQTTDGGTWFKPGELIEGRASWHFDEDVDAVEVRLFWYTTGKGTQDIGVVRGLRTDAPDPSGNRDFSIRVPEGPYSFSGKLITLAWAIELVALPGGETERLDLLDRTATGRGGHHMTSIAIARRRPADNPFASHRVEGLAFRFNGSGLGEISRRLEETGGRGAIVGPKGSGKTTLLEELASALPGERVHVRIGGGCGHPWRTARAQLPRPVRPKHAVLVDGAEQIGPIGWRLLLRATRPARSFVATLHRPGLLPTLIECRTDHALLGDLVEELSPEDAPMLERGLEELFHRHSGNIRLCLRELYDVYAGRATLSS